MSNRGYTDEQISPVSTILSICQRNCIAPRFLASCIVPKILHRRKEVLHIMNCIRRIPFHAKNHREFCYHNWNTSLGGVSPSKITAIVLLRNSHKQFNKWPFPRPEEERNNGHATNNCDGTPKNSFGQHIESSKPKVSPNLKPRETEHRDVLQLQTRVQIIYSAGKL